MICNVNQTNIALNNIAPPAMNYGQSWRYNKLDKVNYEYNISLEEFIVKTQNWFLDIKNEILEESKKNKTSDYPFQDKFAAKGFPSLKEMIVKHTNLLTEFIKQNDLDLLNLLTVETPFPNKNEPSYLINSLDWVKIKDEISFGGSAFLIENNIH